MFDVREKNTVLLHMDTMRLLVKLPMESRGEVITKILATALGGQLPAAEDGSREDPPRLDTCADIVYTAMQDQIDREYGNFKARCRKRQESAVKRWAKELYGDAWEPYYEQRLKELRRPSKAQNYLQRPDAGAEDFAISLDDDAGDAAS